MSNKKKVKEEVVWQFLDSSWFDYDSKVAKLIEQEYQKNKYENS